MSAKIIPFTGLTKLDLSADRVLTSALGRLEGVVLIGWEKDSGDLYACSSYADGGTVLWLLEKTKRSLLS